MHSGLGLILKAVNGLFVYGGVQTSHGDRHVDLAPSTPGTPALDCDSGVL